MTPHPALARPRPVAETPVGALAGDAPELAKRWLIALIATRPLPGAQRVAIEQIVHQAPALCAHMVRALASDLECDRLAPGGDLVALAARAGSMAGADEPAGAVSAVEALRGVLWSALMAELREPPATLVSELAGRLSHVCALVAAAAVSSVSAVPGARRGAGPDTRRAEVPAPAPDMGPTTPAAAPARPGWSPGREDASAPPPPTIGAVASQQRPASPAESGRPGDGPSSISGEGPASWVGSIGRRLERYQEDALPFAVLLIELVDLDRLRQATPAEELALLVGQVERAVSGALRPADVLTRESVGRYWLVTPETDAEGARALAERVAFAVQSDASHRGAPLQVAIGTAVCPDDGLDAANLAARADIAMYGARARGRPVVTLDEPR